MRPICLHMIVLLFTLLYLIIWLKINLLILLKDPSIEKALPTLHVMTETYFYLGKLKKYYAWKITCKIYVMCWAVCWTTFCIRFGTKLYRQVVWMPMGTNCAPLIANLFLFCYDRDFMVSLSDDKQADIIDAFNTTAHPDIWLIF